MKSARTVVGNGDIGEDCCADIIVNAASSRSVAPAVALKRAEIGKVEDAAPDFTACKCAGNWETGKDDIVQAIDAVPRNSTLVQSYYAGSTAGHGYYAIRYKVPKVENASSTARGRIFGDCAFVRAHRAIVINDSAAEAALIV